MYDRDSVIRFATIAAQNNSDIVRDALRYLVYGQHQDQVRHAECKLRDALVAQASGFETNAHDGGTFDARVQAAKDALAAWDGPARLTIAMGSVIVRCSKDLVYKAGFATSIDVNGVEYAHESITGSAVAELATALSEGFTDDTAMLRAIALQAERIHAAKLAFDARKAAEETAKAAGMQLAAERERSKREG